MAKKLKGMVVSDVMDKTIVVLVDRYVRHPKYKKYIKKRKKYKAHDEKNEYKKGDRVIIQECRPISKDKHFKVIEKI
ncbi:MAG: 30S ribosomal protein S17 [Candidatus Terrybacteria bacterium]|nr:30S ribosomal protein S17 [Candidatus Terrybacteria bacterium]